MLEVIQLEQLYTLEVYESTHVRQHGLSFVLFIPSILVTVKIVDNRFSLIFFIILPLKRIIISKIEASTGIGHQKK